MGLGKWLARKGNIGGTARWAAKGFWSALKIELLDIERLENNDRASTEYVLDDLAVYCLGIRNLGLNYQEFVEQDYEQIPLNIRENYNSFQRQITTYRMDEANSLIKLVLSVLKVEAELHLNMPKYIITFIDIIEEELVKCGVGERFIYGSGNPTSDEDKSRTKEYLFRWSVRPPY